MNSENKRLENYKKQLLEIINKHLPGCKIYLFGSRARKTNQPGADIDLALDMVESSIDFNTIIKIHNEIEETTIPLMVDLVDLNTSSEALKSEVKKEGILWKI